MKLKIIGIILIVLSLIILTYKMIHYGHAGGSAIDPGPGTGSLELGTKPEIICDLFTSLLYIPGLILILIHSIRKSRQPDTD